ncbi:MAG: hypothetical protein AAGI38_13875 [Bacteroidota bacterium]
MKYIFTLFGLLVFSHGTAQVFNDQQFRMVALEGIEQVYNLNFEGAEQTFSSLTTTHASHPAPHFLLAFNRWWQTYISETMDTYHGYIEEKLDQALELNEPLENKPGYELEYSFFQYMSYAFKARLQILKGELFSAANTGRKALPHLKEGFKHAEKSPEFYFSSGIYHYYAEAYPKAHPIVKPFMVFFPDGDAEKGLTELLQAANTVNFTQFEAKFYLCDIYLEELHEFAKGLDMTRQLSNQFPQNTWFKVNFAKALIYTGKFKQAESILKSVESKYNQVPGSKTKNIDSRTSRYTTIIMARTANLLGHIALQYHHNYQQALSYLNESNRYARLAKLEDHELYPHNDFLRGLAFDLLRNRNAAVVAYKRAARAEENEAVKSMARKGLRQPLTLSVLDK